MKGGKEEKKKRSQASQGMELWIFVWKLTLIMDFMRLCMNFHAWLVSSLSPNLGVLLGFHLNPKIIESKVGKTPYCTR